jgi:hypothetical protein
MCLCIPIPLVLRIPKLFIYLFYFRLVLIVLCYRLILLYNLQEGEGLIPGEMMVLCMTVEEIPFQVLFNCETQQIFPRLPLLVTVI